MNQYANLEIRIFDRENEGYPVEMTLNNEAEFGRVYLDPVAMPQAPTADAAADGENLYNWLLSDQAMALDYARIRGRHPLCRIRLRIDADAPELHALPWELLREPAGDGPALDIAAATATPFSRYLASERAPGSPVLKRPIKILVAIANPSGLNEYDLAPLDEELEWRLLQEAAAGVDDVELTRFPEPAEDGRRSPFSLDGLKEALEDGYHILHIVAHGGYSERTGSVLFLAGDDGAVRRAPAEQVAQMLARRLSEDDSRPENQLRLVFLAACQTAGQSSSGAFRDLAPQLVRAGVPAVLAMQGRVAVETARRFAGGFYRELLQHGNVDQAANEARSTLLAAGLPGAELPLLISRLRSNQLLGMQGTIVGGGGGAMDRQAQQEQFWQFLLDNISDGLCIPFLGPRVTNGLLPSRDFVSEQLADHFNYPLVDRQNLARVAQFVDIYDAERLHKRYQRQLKMGLFTNLEVPRTTENRDKYWRPTFKETAERLEWSRRVLQIQEDELHHLLADLALPLYVTTNFDNFMTLALAHKGLDPRRTGPRWQLDTAGAPLYYDEEPTVEKPVVFQLNGYDGDPEQMEHLVLSEDDYLAHHVRLSRDWKAILPSYLWRKLAQSSYLFLGYQLGDWEFRVLLQGLIHSVQQLAGAKKRHVGVQLEVDKAPSEDKAREYLSKYLGQYHIDIYWGTAGQFVSELHAHWREDQERQEDEWE